MSQASDSVSATIGLVETENLTDFGSLPIAFNLLVNNLIFSPTSLSGSPHIAYTSHSFAPIFKAASEAPPK